MTLKTFETADLNGPAVSVHHDGLAIVRTYRTTDHLEAASRFAEAYGLKAPKITGRTALGYVFTTNAEEAPTMTTTTTTITDKADVTREQVHAWGEDSLVTRGGGRLDWKKTVAAIKENHGVVLPEDNRHPVSTKAQRFLRELLEA